jgi:hypothetical protein
MTYYVFIENEKINGTGQCKVLNEDILNIVVEEEIYNNIDKYIYQDGEIVLDPDYEAKQQDKELIRINALTLDSSIFYKEILRTSDNTKHDIQQLIQNNTTLTDYQKENLFIDLQGSSLLIRGSYFITTIGSLLNYKPEDLNYLFENKVFPF